MIEKIYNLQKRKRQSILRLQALYSYYINGYTQIESSDVMGMTRQTVAKYYNLFKKYKNYVKNN